MQKIINIVILFIILSLPNFPVYYTVQIKPHIRGFTDFAILELKAL